MATEQPEKRKCEQHQRKAAALSFDGQHQADHGEQQGREGWQEQGGQQGFEHAGNR